MFCNGTTEKSPSHHTHADNIESAHRPTLNLLSTLLQLTFADAEYNAKCKLTRRDRSTLL